MDHITGIDRHQIQMLALDDFVAKDSMARIINAFPAPDSLSSISQTKENLCIPPSLLSLEQNFKRG